MMNKMKMDRRQAACVTEFGLVAPYVTIPLGYGVIFQGIVAENMTANGMPIEMIEVWPHTIILGAGMLVGLIGSWWFFRKPRDYQDISLEGISLEDEAIRLNKGSYRILNRNRRRSVRPALLGFNASGRSSRYSYRDHRRRR